MIMRIGTLVLSLCLLAPGLARAQAQVRVGVVVPEVVVQQAPPADIAEVQPPQPNPSYFWINGHWYWNGVRYQWAGGHWEHGHGHRGWERAHYERRGPAWVLVPGHWR